MFDIFQQYIQNRASFTEAELARVRAVTTIRRLRKKQYLLQEGDVWSFHAFVTKGILRTYTIDEKGLEHIIYFALENWWTGDRESLLTGKPATFNIDAVEDAEVALINKANFNQLRADIPAFDRMISDIIEKSLATGQQRVNSTISHSAEQKYQQFLEKYPDMALRIPQHMIASYLGITPETLSRVRRQVKP